LGMPLVRPLTVGRPSRLAARGAGQLQDTGPGGPDHAFGHPFHVRRSVPAAARRLAKGRGNGSVGVPSLGSGQARPLSCSTSPLASARKTGGPSGLLPSPGSREPVTAVRRPTEAGKKPLTPGADPPLPGLPHRRSFGQPSAQSGFFSCPGLELGVRRLGRCMDDQVAAARGLKVRGALPA